MFFFLVIVMFYLFLVKSGGGDLGTENCLLDWDWDWPMMGQMKMEDQQLGPGHDFVGSKL